MKQAPSPDVVSRYVRWALLLFFAYALYSGAFSFFPNTHLPGSAPTPAEVAKDKDCARHNPFDDFSLIASTIIPTTFPIIHLQDVTFGSGTAAACGQHATLRYQYALENGSVIYSNLKDGGATKVVIGDGSLLHGLELGLIGMKPGGSRKVAFPYPFSFGRVKDISTLQDSDKFAIKPAAIGKSIIYAQVALDKVSPELPPAPLPLRIMERKPNNGTRALCGDTVQTRMTLWKVDGSKVFSSDDNGAPFVFTLGAPQVPFGVEQGVQGMTEGSERTVIMPASYAKPLVAADDGAESSTGAMGKLPEEILVMEVSLEHIGEAAKATPKTPIVHEKEEKPAEKPAVSGDKDTDKPSDAGKKPAASGGKEADKSEKDDDSDKN